ncbi:hypothetical protein F1C14_01965 [Clostridium perfringens]|nr:hypothetical protein F1C14_01965 [Clostridium perfringens]
MTDKELSEKLKEIQKLKYTRIEALYITPTGTGVGSEVVKILINRLKKRNKRFKIYTFISS